MFKVLQFNMQFGQSWDEADPDGAPVRLDWTLAEILRHDADLILLQEVERAQPGGLQIDPPPNYTRLRAALAGYHSTFSYPKSDPRELPFGIGLAIFSKTELWDTMERDLPAPPITFDFFGRQASPTDRLLIGAKTVLGGRELQVFNTHLQAFFMIGSSSDDHPQQRNLVADILRASPGPTLIGGDFNIGPNESVLRQFAECGYRTVQQSAITWRRRPYVLDHLFYNRQLEARRHAIVPTPASDHHALTAEFEFA
jgi:endonuclease/exonuclease/phosphatase family metal-dependent hydrolase